MALPGNLFTRDDTLFGICEGLGQDLGFNPLWLRLAFLPALFFFPKATFGIYALLGLIVYASRALFPAPADADAQIDAVADTAAHLAAPQPASASANNLSMAA